MRTKRIPLAALKILGRGRVALAATLVLFATLNLSAQTGSAVQGGIGAGAKPNQIVYWPRLSDRKIHTLTPNPEVLVRFYDPEKPIFEKTWVLPDIEKVSNP